MWTHWTPEQEAELRRLWDTGDSAARIGGIMGITRNAVLGKAHRMELSDRATRHALGRRFKAPPKKRAPRERKPPLLTRQSTVTGCYAYTPPPKPRVPELTKTEMRAMLTRAVLNTGGHL